MTWCMLRPQQGFVPVMNTLPQTEMDLSIIEGGLLILALLGWPLAVIHWYIQTVIKNKLCQLWKPQSGGVQKRSSLYIQACGSFFFLFICMFHIRIAITEHLCQMVKVQRYAIRGWSCSVAPVMASHRDVTMYWTHPQDTFTSLQQSENMNRSAEKCTTVVTVYELSRRNDLCFTVESLKYSVWAPCFYQKFWDIIRLFQMWAMFLSNFMSYLPLFLKYIVACFLY